ncbi:LysR family transcriptional regulator [Clostridium sp. JNZ J1-5]
MDIRQLKYFLTIAEEGSISRAAEKLHMAQPPLSQQLKLLEEELGVKLMERSTRKLQLTDIGKMLQHRAKQILELVDTTIKEVKDISEGLQGTLSIGTVSSAGATLLPEKIHSFHKKYPGINFEILDEDTYKIIDLLNKGVIDIGIIRTPFNLENFESICLPNETMIAISRNITWKDEQESIYLADLVNKPLIIQRRYEEVILELCHSAGFEPRILCRSNDVRTVLLWASTGLGISIVPKACIDLLPDTNLQYIEIAEPSLKVGTAIIWPKTRYMSSAARHFLETFNL